MYRVIRVILESSLESEILRTLRTPSLSDNETLKTLRTQILMSLKLFVLSDYESLGVADSSYFKTPTLSDFETLRTFRLRIFGEYRLSVLLRLGVFWKLKLFVL